MEERLGLPIARRTPSLYLEIIKSVLDSAVQIYAQDSGTAAADVLKKIRGHIDKTTDEYWKDSPEIQYEDPLCRLGYLYRHGAANATLFERVLKGSRELQTKLRHSEQGSLSICSVGGGPGTELLAG